MSALTDAEIDERLAAVGEWSRSGTEIRRELSDAASEQGTPRRPGPLTVPDVDREDAQPFHGHEA